MSAYQCRRSDPRWTRPEWMKGSREEIQQKETDWWSIRLGERNRRWETDNETKEWETLETLRREEREEKEEKRNEATLIFIRDDASIRVKQSTDFESDQEMRDAYGSTRFKVDYAFDDKNRTVILYPYEFQLDVILCELVLRGHLTSNHLPIKRKKEFVLKVEGCLQQPKPKPLYANPFGSTHLHELLYESEEVTVEEQLADLSI